MILQSLSPVQREAVLHVSGPAIITAGAGSGKTRTLTSKIAYLIRELRYDPGRILAITFTNKAADEMKRRLEKAVARPVSDFPWVRTFHSACFMMLKRHCELIGFQRPLTISDESKQKTHLKKALTELDVDSKYLAASSFMISNAKNSADPIKYINLNGRVPRKLEVYRYYNERLAECNSVDFDDILMFTRDILRDFHEIREKYRHSFDYILIDEFQDTNDIQNQIVDLLVRDGRLTVVGDDYQSIYKFRGADPCYFINFPKKFPDAKIFRLEQNYRSTSQIVAAADALIANNANRMEKECFSDRPGASIELRELFDDSEEARWVADKCWDYIHSDRIPLDRIAVLFRTKFTSLPFERAFRAAGVPYTMVGAQAFFQRREVQDINSYLISAANPKDDVSFERIINIPKRGVGPTALKKILANREKRMSLQDACRKAIQGSYLIRRASSELERLLLLLQSVRDLNPGTAIRKLVGELDYESHLRAFAENAEDFQNRMENIKQLIYDASRHETVADYLEEAALVRNDQEEDDVGRGIRLSTIHAAKGLEFQVVFVVALEEGILPHRRSVDSDGEGESEEAVEEERRLMYVAMTRASDRLHLTYAINRRGDGALPSRFINEISSYLQEIER